MVKKLSIDDLNRVAKERGGICVSTVYINSSTPIEWECAKGHRWMASYSNVKYSTWCPYCAPNSAGKLSKEELLQRCKTIAIERNGFCNSATYENARSHLSWECAEGHRWNATPDNTIRAGKWCPVCGSKNAGRKKIKYSFASCEDYAKERGGRILSSEVMDGKRLFEWQCSNGHKWKAQPNKVLSLKSWCTKCRSLDTINKIKDKIKDKNFKLISGKIENFKSIVFLECGMGHSWKCTTASVFFQDTGCPQCAGTLPLSIEAAQELAKSKGGTCLSTEYKNAKTHLQWQCKEGHIWNAVYDAVSGGKRNKGTWCSQCAHSNKEKKYSFEFANTLAQSRNGKFLSEQMNYVLDRYEWECANGHKWKTSFSAILNGGWCPSCSRHLGERFTRIAFETLFDKKFPTTRPAWLRSEAGTQLSLDGYCEELKIAFEHQGEQHYSNKNYYGNSDIEQEKIKTYDKRKKILCKQYGVDLFIIPEVPRLTSLDALGPLIVLEARKINKPPHNSFNEINFERAYIEDGRMHKLKERANEKGGKVIEKTYFGMRYRYTWRCAEGHEWKQTADAVLRGIWCPHCSGRHNITLDSLKNLAASKNIEILTTEYKNNMQKISCKCTAGHIFERPAKSLLKGLWCTACDGKRILKSL